MDVMDMSNSLDRKWRYLLKGEDAKLQKRVCPVCGMYGYNPCVACRAFESDTSVLRNDRLEKDEDEPDEVDLALRFTDEERERYKRLRKIRDEMGELYRGGVRVQLSTVGSQGVDALVM